MKKILLLAVVVLGLAVALSADDLKRYQNMRRM